MGERARRHSEKKNIFQRIGAWFMSLKGWQRGLLIALIVIVIVGIIAIGYVFSKLDMLNKVDIDEGNLSIVDMDGYANILLLGVDSRDMDNLQGTRSDAMIIVSINEETRDVKLISVYRDTYLKMGDTSTYDKITHACVYGGPEMTVRSLNQAMDLNISKFVVVNFKAVADLVDAVGGIDVDVQQIEIQQLNKYARQTANNIGRKDYGIVKKAGLQTLDGCQAVSYSRIRKGVGDDYKRTERMRTVIMAVFDKAKTMSWGKADKIVDMMMPQVQTNLGNSDIIALAMRTPTYKINGSVGWPYNVSSGYIGKVSYVFPNNLEANIVKLHQEVFMRTDFVASDTARSISNTIAANIAAAKEDDNYKDKKDENLPQEELPSVDPTTPGPIEPTDPSGPTEPSEPTEPSDPSGPTEPTDPGTTEPTDPGTGTDTE